MVDDFDRICIDIQTDFNNKHLQEQKREQLIQSIEQEIENIESWKKTEIQTFTTKLIEYKETKNEYLFTNELWPELKKLTKLYAKQYLETLPIKAKQLILGEYDTFDDFLYIPLIQTIEKWKPNQTNTMVFWKYYENNVKYIRKNIIKKINTKKLKYIEIQELGDDMQEQLFEHYELNPIENQYVFDKTYISFLRTLKQGRGSLLYMMVENHMTDADMAEHLKVSRQTVINWKKEIKQAWIEFNKE